MVWTTGFEPAYTRIQGETITKLSLRPDRGELPMINILLEGKVKINSGKSDAKVGFEPTNSKRLGYEPRCFDRLHTSQFVEPGGIKPPTFAVQMRRSIS